MAACVANKRVILVALTPRSHQICEEPITWRYGFKKSIEFWANNWNDFSAVSAVDVKVAI